MIAPEKFYELLAQSGTDFFSGVPDSLLKNFCAYITDTVPPDRHIIAANEGCAAALAAGYHFATGKIPLIYMQNSGIGNAVNPLLSLIDPDVYSVPMLLVIGWRGEPGVHDEPQHVKQGKVTCRLLEAMDIPYAILSDSESDLPAQIEAAYSYMKSSSAPYAFVVRKGTFGSYTLRTEIEDTAKMTRENAIEKILLAAPKEAVFVSTTGMASRELYELREKHAMPHDADFLTVGSMGHASQIALAAAMHSSPPRPVFCIDGDGASIMQMGGIATIGVRKPSNLCHFVLNNGAHDSVGGQPTVGLQISLSGIAKACGYERIETVSSEAELDAVLASLSAAAADNSEKLTFIEVKVRRGARKDLGRPKSSPQENKRALMNFLNSQK
ncbi:MAG: phosphonopyruvate decarboxylase [Bacteroides sp.]|nr:phosphonopyruvate decarboxylase [Prevotella sp.]MCM1407882.1 phosphonopyruvate decarboxylase [Treponema brennaborense]MCM1469624.1 phosphonopyruvate decarboxylase [Bacteroides sp.]